jgi:hypothetical protein
MIRKHSTRMEKTGACTCALITKLKAHEILTNQDLRSRDGTSGPGACEFTSADALPSATRLIVLDGGMTTRFAHRRTFSIAHDFEIEEPVTLVSFSRMFGAAMNRFEDDIIRCALHMAAHASVRDRLAIYVYDMSGKMRTADGVATITIEYSLTATSRPLGKNMGEDACGLGPLIEATAQLTDGKDLRGMLGRLGQDAMDLFDSVGSPALHLAVVDTRHACLPSGCQAPELRSFDLDVKLPPDGAPTEESIARARADAVLGIVAGAALHAIGHAVDISRETVDVCLFGMRSAAYVRTGGILTLSVDYSQAVVIAN